MAKIEKNVHIENKAYLCVSPNNHKHTKKQAQSQEIRYKVITFITIWQKMNRHAKYLLSYQHISIRTFPLKPEIISK